MAILQIYNLLGKKGASQHRVWIKARQELPVFSIEQIILLSGENQCAQNSPEIKNAFTAEVSYTMRDM